MRRLLLLFLLVLTACGTPVAAAEKPAPAAKDPRAAFDALFK